MQLLSRRLAWVITLVAFLAAAAEAHVTRVEILSRTDVQDGRAFGLAGFTRRSLGGCTSRGSRKPP